MLRALTHPLFPIVAVLLGGAASVVALQLNVDVRAVAAAALGLAAIAAVMSLRNWAVGELERPLLVEELGDLNEVADDLIEAHAAIDTRLSSVEIDVDDRELVHTERFERWEMKFAEHEARVRQLADAVARSMEARRLARATAEATQHDVDARALAADQAATNAAGRTEGRSEIEVRRRRPIAPQKAFAGLDEDWAAQNDADDHNGADAQERADDAERHADVAEAPIIENVAADLAAFDVDGGEIVSRAAGVTPRARPETDSSAVEAVEEDVSAPTDETRIEALDHSAQDAATATATSDEPEDERPTSFRESWARRASELRRRREELRKRSGVGEGDGQEAAPLSVETAEPTIDAPAEVVDATPPEPAPTVVAPPPPSVPVDPRRGLLLQPIMSLPDQGVRAFETVTGSASTPSLEADRIALVGSLAALGDLRAVDPQIALFCNVSVAALREGGLDAALSAAGRSTAGVEGLVLELRHSDLRAAWDETFERLQALRRAGVGLSCDGVADLAIDVARMDETGFGYLKIDAAASRERDPDGAATAALTLRASAGALSLVFERVDLQADLDWVRAVDAELGQGLTLSGPKRFDLALDSLRQARRRAAEAASSIVEAPRARIEVDALAAVD